MTEQDEARLEELLMVQVYEDERSLAWEQQKDRSYCLICNKPSEPERIKEAFENFNIEYWQYVNELAADESIPSYDFDADVDGSDQVSDEIVLMYTHSPRLCLDCAINDMTPKLVKYYHMRQQHFTDELSYRSDQLQFVNEQLRLLQPFI